MSEEDVVENINDGVQPEEVEQPEIDERESEQAEITDEEEAATSEDSDAEEKPKRRSRAEERINALTKDKYEAQKQAQQYQEQLAQIQQYLQQQAAQQSIGENMPTLADVNYDETAYQQAVQQWSQNQVQNYQENLYRQQMQQVEAQQRQAEAMKFQTAIAEGQAKYPDFTQKVMDPNLPSLREINSSAFEAVMDSDNAVDIAYYLASNPQEVYAFASMSPVQAIKQVTRIEAQFAAKPQSRAPLSKPPGKVTGNSEAVKDPETMSTAEWLAWRNNQLANRNR
jgi:DNA repair exonuclease SbcCD ATPase subunit